MNRSRKQTILLVSLLVMGLCVLPAQAAKKEVTFWVVSDTPQHNAIRQARALAFEEVRPDVKVRFEVFPYNEYFQKLTTAMAGGGMPDVFYADSPMIANYVYFDVLEPLDKYYTEEDFEDLYPLPLAEATIETSRGSIWSMPFQQASEVLFYNTELFKEAGIIAPKAVDDAWTWDEFLDAAKKLTRDTNGDGRTDIWGFAMSRTQLHSMQTWMAQNGQVELVSPDGLNVDGYLNSPKVIEAMEFYQSLTQVHKVTPAEMIPDIFPRGLTAMEQAKSQVIPFYEENYPDFEYDIMPLPKKERQATNCGGFHLGISRQSKDKDLAAEFLIWMAGKEGHKYWIEHGGPLPCRRSTTAALSRFASHPYNLVVDQWERYAVSRPVTPGYAFLHDKVNEVFKDIALGAPVKETLESAVWQINDELSRYQ